MQRVARAITILKQRALRPFHQDETVINSVAFPHSTSMSSDPPTEHKGLENITVREILNAKEEQSGDKPVFWCQTIDSVYDAVKHMTEKNVGSLVVVKPGDEKLLAGIITERDYLRKIIVQGRSPKHTRVREIMTEENKLITVTPDTKILQAMQLMTDKHIRHVPVIDLKVVGLISIVDVVKAVVEQQHDELKRLNEFIRGDYY